MKKVFLPLLGLIILAGCNNNNPLAKKQDDNNKTETDDQPRKKKGGLFGGGGDEETNKGASNWTAAQRSDWMNKCLDQFADNPKVKNLCSCVIGKIEQQYPNPKDAESISDEQGQKIVRSCTDGLGNENDNTLTGPNDNNTGGEHTIPWTDLQRQTFIHGCAVTAQQKQGFAAEQANTYCDCMTRKVERKFSFDQAAKLKASDLQTQEWIDAAEDCRNRVY
jgi:hypothetical protein